VLRTLPLLLLPFFVTLVAGVLLHLTTGEGSPPPGPPPMPFPVSLLIQNLALVAVAVVLVILVRRGQSTMPALALIGVWTALSALSTLQFGIMSFWPALLILPICAAGLLVDAKASVLLALLATVLVAGVAWLHAQGIVVVAPPPPPGPPPPPPPPGLDRPPPPWLRSNLWILGLGYWVGLFWTVAALTSLLAAGLKGALRRSRAQAGALSELSAQLEARVAAQTAELLDQSREAATMEERTRLAREIHDTLAQGLTGVIVQLAAAERALQAAPAAAQQHLDLAQRMARESLAEARRSVWNLRAPALERGDLGNALRSVVDHFPGGATTARFEEAGEPWPLPSSVESALLRVCQEALVNVAKHASASEVTVALAYTPGDVRLSVADDGVGFDEAALRQSRASAAPWSGFGLLGMRERLAVLGGRLELANQDGARVVAVVPRSAQGSHASGTGTPNGRVSQLEERAEP
jgi:signal transduction histidine kinase